MISRRPSLSFSLVFILAAATVLAVIVLIQDTGSDQQSEANGNDALTASALNELLALYDEEAFERLSGPWEVSLPDDYGGHPEVRTETWMIAAHLEDKSGAPVGVTFSLSRFGLRAQTSATERSPWDIRAFYRAHVTLVRDGAAAALGEERFSRGAGAAGHDSAAREVWLDHWQLTYGEAPGGDGLTVTASVDGLPIRLVLTPVKGAQAAIGGDAAPLRGFAMPRMAVEGLIGAGDAETGVRGIAWLDRFWGELPLPGGPLAYDRLILQLDDETDVTVLRSQRRDGRGGATVDGLIVYSAGDVETLSGDILRMTAVERWKSDRGGTQYPTSWQIEGAGLELEVRPLTENQEQSFVLPGWSGIVTASGRHDGAEVSGVGTLQLTGYNEP